ncbi:HAMP domain-containing sensor histidine kinase [Ammoniphilus sp. CFH 90114]|uniref:sensor histidine kinase n=1 Tax=Ammoniphilus sp. CFH 90114 TaxID=2493665 RepID=UPI00100FB810|nr:HAMP domain-containing sensor histidine kinase [Ammoniphilus sp. CFH 90114]RXT06534.1 HAMP domain-containing histidine kinase [Ammoniphilus sp. CFH 90114]
MKDLIVQLFSILFPILLYQMFWEKEIHTLQESRKKLVIGVTCAISIILCMTFPVTLLDGHRYDLRDVPLLIGILYGGIEVGLLLTGLMIFYRYVLGGDGLYLTILTHAIVLPFVFYGIHRFEQYSRNKRMRIAAILCFLLSITIMIASLVYFHLKTGLEITKDQVFFFLGFILFNTLGISIVVFLIEKSRENASITFELQESEKMRVVSHLAAAIAHEVRNPLTVIRGFIQLLAKDEIDADKKQTYAEMMLNELDRAQTIITDYLTFARPESEIGELELVDVKSHILKAVNVLFPYALAQGVAIETTVQEALYVKAEKTKITQIMVNLLKNAIESMPKGGIMQVRADVLDNHVIIDVIDQGIGMTQEQVDRLGSPFFTTKEKGTGLGIMVCYRIVEALEGTIQVKSEIGKGTHFQVAIPRDSNKEKENARDVMGMI